MQYEKSCGAIVFTREGGKPRHLIVQSLKGVYGFPKGHMEGRETEEQTALRAIYEETGVRPVLTKGFRETDEYPLPGKEGVIKRVIYFLAEYGGQEVRFPEKELLGAGLMDLETALERLQPERCKALLRQANELLSRV